jgi:histidyl-tRNA synthetase
MAAAGPRLAAYVTSADPGATAARLEIVTKLRSAGLASRADLGTRRLGRQLEQAARENAHFAVIVGDELAQGQVQLRDLEAGTQREVPLADLAKEIARAETGHRHG